MALMDGMGASAPLMQTFENHRVKPTGALEDVVQIVAAAITLRHKTMEAWGAKGSLPTTIPAPEVVAALGLPPSSVAAPAVKKPRKPRMLAEPAPVAAPAVETPPREVPAEVAEVAEESEEAEVVVAAPCGQRF